MYASLPKAPTSTHPEHPPARASSSVFPWRSCSATTASALNSDGKPYPLRTTRSACLRTESGVLRETWTFDEGCSRCISSTISSSRSVTSLEPSDPSARNPPRLMLAKSVYVPLSSAVTPTLGGAVWLLNLTKKHSSSSRAAASVSVPSTSPLR